MSILTGKNILVIGDEGAQIIELEAELKKHRVNLFTVPCARINKADLEAKTADIILLNHLHDGNACDMAMAIIATSSLLSKIPLFTLVGNDETKINEALMMGAADYITAHEPITSVIKKMKQILGQPDNFSAPNIFDVPEDVPDVSSKGRRVFVVEDDSLLRNLLDSKLTSCSFPHELASTGEDIINKIKKFKPEVLILDLMLPVKNGFEILAELKADNELKSLPVIVFSNRDAQEDKKRVFELGADRFYVKAMTDLSLLIETIEELCA